MVRRKKFQGFTLAEMAIVVVIGSILLMAGVKVLTVQMESAAYSATRSKQETIKQALSTYLGNNRRLPCPDTRNGNGPGGGPPGGPSFTPALPPDGVENRATAGNTTTNCAANFGVLPYTTLGLEREIALDGWGNFFSYHLYSTVPNNWELTASFADTNTGGLTINDKDAAGVPVTLTNTAVVALVSHGKNGTGAFTIKGTRVALPVAATNQDELENTNSIANAIYYKREYSDNAAIAGGAFDDLVMFVTAEDLIAPLWREGTLRTSATRINQQLTDINNAIVGYMVGNATNPVTKCTTPPDLASL
ncbi:MAG: hypothetical protein FD130_639, partial [Halothiobacillaceae bacterium]